jgi:hypothetical protein
MQDFHREVVCALSAPLATMGTWQQVRLSASFRTLLFSKGRALSDLSPTRARVVHGSAKPLQPRCAIRGQGVQSLLMALSQGRKYLQRVDANSRRTWPDHRSTARCGNASALFPLPQRSGIAPKSPALPSLGSSIRQSRQHCGEPPFLRSQAACPQCLPDRLHQLSFRRRCDLAGKRVNLSGGGISLPRGQHTRAHSSLTNVAAMSVSLWPQTGLKRTGDSYAREPFPVLYP